MVATHSVKARMKMILHESTVAKSVVLALMGVSLSTDVTEGATRNVLVGQAARSPKPPVMSELKDYMVYAQLPDGRLMGIMGRTQNGIPEAAARYSTDDGFSWSEPETLFKLPKDIGGWGLQNVFLDHGGELHLIYLNDANAGGKDLYQMRFDIWHVRSLDRRTGWKDPDIVWKGYAGSLLSVAQLRSGRILLPFCYLTPRTWANRGSGFDTFTFMGRFSSTATYSDDNGATWRQVSPELKEATPYIGADGGIEPIVIQLKDGRVWMLIRTQDDYFFESFSKDGSRWSPPRPTRIITSDSPPSLTRLSDGRIFMLWNDCLRFPYANGGRHVLHGAISEDEGRTWRGYREVARNPLVGEPPPPNGDHGVAYTVPALTREGTVVTSLSTGPGGGTYLLHVDPSWLYETRQADDFSKGLSEWSAFGTKGVEAVPNPGKQGARALQMVKPEADWPAAAVWNFPMGVKGRLRLKVLLRPGFAGARLGLTDHFSVPFDELDEIYNLYNLNIGPEGKLADGKRLDPGEWHNLEFDWDCGRNRCGVTADGRPVAVLRLTRTTAAGVCYLRIVSTADRIDTAGLLVESVDADVSESWPR